MARSTFKVLFYVNGSKEKNGIVPIMGRVTINGTVAQFSCKQSVPKTLWDIKGNRAKGKSKEARDINLALDNIKAQIIKHYQRISDREAFVTAEMVRNAYQETLRRALELAQGAEMPIVNLHLNHGVYFTLPGKKTYLYAERREEYLQHIDEMRRIVEERGRG